MTPGKPPEVVSPLEKIEAETAKVLQELFEQLPEEDQTFLQRGSIFLGLNASVCGLIANSSFRKILNISQARIVSTLPTIVIPLTATYVACSSFIVHPVLTGKLVAQSYHGHCCDVSCIKLLTVVSEFAA
ncbi:hypothetical protein Y1Q_0020672 [Alligator mississippiensis]|uniref:Uncharacterized protein n=1 Tax=Alligator mississippiensis TaxID=8496 RepID=A0A151LZE1_ALLMI|nr:hypothetical protein Y1Q_0020672 [Alligator mississippiensis]